MVNPGVGRVPVAFLINFGMGKAVVVSPLGRAVGVVGSPYHGWEWPDDVALYLASHSSTFFPVGCGYFPAASVGFFFPAGYGFFPTASTGFFFPIVCSFFLVASVGFFFPVGCDYVPADSAGLFFPAVSAGFFPARCSSDEPAQRSLML
ncbi:hypothetical protein BHE74_00038749 [Ensete ventricosum]|nr:hypothetical protein BHE74_00038749 [Ensete ventricosum]